MENTPGIPTNNENILDDVRYTLYEASGGKRFANYLIDRVGFYVLWRLLLIKVYAWCIFTFNVPTDSYFTILALGYIVIISLLGLLIAGMEAATGGKTIGKFITGTRAVNEDGTRVGTKKAVLRFLCRLVPFEAFSALGSPCYPWHDRWTHTLVIDENLTTMLPQDLPQ